MQSTYQVLISWWGSGISSMQGRPATFIVWSGGDGGDGDGGVDDGGGVIVV